MKAIFFGQLKTVITCIATFYVYTEKSTQLRITIPFKYPLEEEQRVLQTAQN